MKYPAEVPQLSRGGAGTWTWVGLSRLAQTHDGYLKMVPTLNHSFPFSVQPCDRILSRYLFKKQGSLTSHHLGDILVCVPSEVAPRAGSFPNEVCALCLSPLLT